MHRSLALHVQAYVERQSIQLPGVVRMNGIQIFQGASIAIALGGLLMNLARTPPQDASTNLGKWRSWAVQTVKKPIVRVFLVLLFAASAGSLFFMTTPESDPSQYRVYLHLRENRQNDAKLIDPVKKIIDDTEFNDRHIFIYQSVSPESKSVAVRSRRVEVEYFSDSKKAEDLSGRLAKKVSEVIPKEFGAVLISRGDPKYGEKDQIGLWLCP